MAYKKDKLLDQSIDAVRKHKLFFIEDIMGFVPCNRSTWYNLFPAGSDELDTIKEELEKNKISIKVSLRKRFYDGDRTAELLALYKLICTPEERAMLSMTGEVNVNVNTSGEQLFNLGLLSEGERKLWYKLYDKACGKVETIDIDYEEMNQKQLGDGNE